MTTIDTALPTDVSALPSAAQIRAMGFVQGLALKVPQVTIFFWIVKLLTTAMGESTSDWMLNHISPQVTGVVLGGAGLVLALGLQFATRRYVAFVYWFGAIMVAIFGTMAADILHVVFGMPYFISAAFFASALAVIFVVWYRFEGTLSVHSINTRRREVFYWATVVVTFCLGTAVGDITAMTLNLGYLTSGVLFGILFAVPFLARRWFGLNEIVAFWFAFVITRPLGASFADWMGKSVDQGGIGVGSGPTGAVLFALIALAVGYLTVTRTDTTGAGQLERVPGAHSLPQG